MKKFYGAVAALLLSLLVIFAGCKTDADKVFEFLKTQKEFIGFSHEQGNTYEVDFTVGKDLSYAFGFSRFGSGELSNYKAEGTQMEYLGCGKQMYTSDWNGFPQRITCYFHVIKLPEAMVEIDGKDCTFYLVVTATSENFDSFALTLVLHDNLNDGNIGMALIDCGTKFPLSVKR